MTINEGMKKYRLPNPTTSEDLEMRFSGMDGKILNFGDKVLMAGYYWNGKGQPSYYAAVYEHLDDDLSCEGAIGLRAVSEVEHNDDGHAIAWALAQKLNKSGAGTASPKHALGIQLAASEHPEPQGARGSRTVVM